MTELTTRERADIALVLDEISRRREQAHNVRSAGNASIDEQRALDLERRARAIERCLERAYPEEQINA